MILIGRMQTDKGKATTVSRKKLPYFTIPVTDRHYMVVRAVKVTEESSPGIYRSTEFWTTSFFYISNLGANYWIGLPRFTSEVSKWRQNYRKGIHLPKPHIPEPRPETAIWIETRERRGGLFFRKYLIYDRTVRTDTDRSDSRGTESHTAV